MKAFFRITFEDISAETATELLAELDKLLAELPKHQTELNLIG
jgi:hypothetical protein